MARKHDETPDLVTLLLGTGAKKQLMTPEEMAKRLAEAGYTIVKDDPSVARKVHSIQTRFKGSKTARFAVISCTHLGSRHQQLTFLETFYDRCVERDIKQVLHCGDLVDGDGKVYRGHEYDVFKHGFQAQLKYAKENYPHRPSVTTQVISGNHDWSFYQRGGADILAQLAETRTDLIYLGPMSARATVDGLRVQMTHGKGGGAYARSYKMQKHIEQFAPEQKPQLYFLGHYHSWAHLSMYRNVYGWQMGCFQSQTDFLKALGLYPEVGGIIVEVDFDSPGSDKPTSAHDEGRSGTVAVRHEVIPFYVPRVDDF